MKNIFFKLLTVCILFLPLISTAQTFTNIDAGLVGLHYSDLAWGDYDNDGDLDVIIAGLNSDENEMTILYKNNGNDTFEEVTTPIPGTYIGDFVWGDYDNDGDLDILIQGYVSNGNSQITKIYVNRGNDIFEDSQIVFPELADGSVAFMDYNNDGFLDVLINGFNDDGNAAYVYKNNGDKSFTQTEIELPGVFKAAYEWADYDNDGDLDVFVAGFGGALMSKLYRNNGDDTFTETDNIFVNIWLGDIAWGDYNNDGNLDIIISGYSLDFAFPDDRIAEIYKNNGDGSFTKLTNHGLPGVSHSTTIWGDYDNDGNLDVFVAGTYQNLDYEWIRVVDVFVNNGDDTFTAANLSFSADSYWGECAWGDYDSDGDLDLIHCGYDDDGTSKTNIYKNESETPNTIPVAPDNLSESVTERTVDLNWNAASDNETPSAGLSYNVYIYNQTTGDTIWQSLSNKITGQRLLPALGNAGQNTSWTINNLPNGDYFWSVQAIDHNFAGSLFATENTFNVEIEQASISVEPEMIDFGVVQIGTYEINSFDIENTGTIDLEISQISASENFMISYDYEGDYLVTLGETTILAGETKTVYVQFYSAQTQYYDEIITIFSNAAYQNEKEIQVTADCQFLDVELLSGKNSKVFNYPNPAGSQTTFYFNFETNEKSELQIYDINGRLLEKYDITNEKELIVNTNKFKQGVYLYRAKNEKNNFIGKLIVK